MITLPRLPFLYICLFLIGATPVQAGFKHLHKKLGLTKSRKHFLAGGIIIGAGVYLYMAHQRQKVEQDRDYWIRMFYENNSAEKKEKERAWEKAAQLEQERNTWHRRFIEVQSKLDDLPVEDITTLKEGLMQAHNMYMAFQEEANAAFLKQEERIQETIPAQLEEKEKRIGQLAHVVQQLNKQIETQKEEYIEAQKQMLVYIWCIGARYKALNKTREHWKKQYNKLLDRYKFENKTWTQIASSSNTLRLEKDSLQEQVQILQTELDQLRNTHWYSGWWGKKKDDEKKED